MNTLEEYLKHVNRIDYLSNVYPCVKEENLEKIITNIYEDKAIEKIIWNRKHIIEYQLVKDKKDCKKCGIKYFCGGGCRAEEHDNKICNFNCEYFKFALWLWSEQQ
ncbi:MAG: hypothetical protein ATN35_08050 [Epulopiscium sp. Nele67-Bin004]|nr:MAG: hypothetical protein ATN35_08050 [Epulopiscium sp. Nele67-Bin004]